MAGVGLVQVRGVELGLIQQPRYSRDTQVHGAAPHECTETLDEGLDYTRRSKSISHHRQAIRKTIIRSAVTGVEVFGFPPCGCRPQ